MPWAEVPENNESGEIPSMRMRWKPGSRAQQHAAGILGTSVMLALCPHPSYITAGGNTVWGLNIDEALAFLRTVN